MNKVDYYKIVSAQTLQDFDLCNFTNVNGFFQISMFLTNELIVPLDTLLTEVSQ